jgi:hypothetical protein
MGKKRKGKKYAKNKTEAKDRSQEPRKSAPITIMTYALPILGGLLLAAAGMLYGTQKIPSIWMFFASAVVFLLAICLHWQQTVIEHAENPPFAFFIQTAVIGDKRGTQLFGEYNRTYLAQIEFILYVKLTNNLSSQSTISDVKVEVRRKKGWWIFPDRWMPTTPIYRGVRLIWVNPPPKPSQLIELEPPRLEPILDRALPPHETVEGCLLLDVGKEWLTAPRPPLYRFTIRDTAGNKEVIIDDVSHGGNMGNAIGFHAVDDVDVSHHTMVHLADSRN